MKFGECFAISCTFFSTLFSQAVSEGLEITTANEQILISFDADTPGIYKVRINENHTQNRPISEPGLEYNPDSHMISTGVATLYSNHIGWIGGENGSPTRFARDGNNNGSEQDYEIGSVMMCVFPPTKEVTKGMTSNAFQLSKENDWAKNAIYFRIQNKIGSMVKTWKFGADFFISEADQDNFSQLKFSYAIDNGSDPAAMSFTEFGPPVPVSQGMTLSPTPAATLSETVVTPGVPDGDYIILAFSDIHGPKGSTIFLDNISITASPISGLNTYAKWAAANKIGGQVAESDTDGDGIPNLMEYALKGLNPTEAESVFYTRDSNDNRIIFMKRPEAVANGDVAYAIEVSSDEWATANIVKPDENNHLLISYTFPSGPSKDLARLKVAHTP